MDYIRVIFMAALLNTLIELNPWWHGDSIPLGISRELYLQRIKKYLATGEIVVLNGVRRSGKTTLLHQTISYLINERGVPHKKILFINFDEPAFSQIDEPIEEILTLYRTDICGEQDIWLVFDEVQTIEGWEKYIKSLYDRGTYHIIISGSSSSLLENRLSTLLSGRYFAVQVFPLTFFEYLQFVGFPLREDVLARTADKYRIMNHLRDYLRYGGFPRVVLQHDESLRTEYLRSYYDTIVFRDIILNNRVRNVKALKDLLYYLFSNCSNLFSYRNLEDQLKIDFATLKEYLLYAQQAKILFEVPLFTYSLKVQSRNNKKCYCIDNGLRNSIAFRFSSDEGRLAENAVFIALMQSGFEPYYWKGTGEVDFVLKHPDDTLSAINVSYTDSPDEREYAGLREFSLTFNKKVQSLILLTKNLEQESGGVQCIPLWKWLCDGPVYGQKPVISGLRH